MSKLINISVIIPTYNSWKTLESCVQSILNQKSKPYEIIVVDNASTDNTSKKIKKIFPEVKLVTLKRNFGVTGGRNAGLKKANSIVDYYIFFDHDMVADKNMLDELVKVAESSENIGIMTPKIFYWTVKKRIWAAGTGINLWTGQVLFRGGYDVGQYDEICEVQVAPAVLLVKKKVVDKIKGFDNKYFATYEDTDYCFRAKRAGFKTYYTPYAMAYHKISPERKDEAERLLSRAYWVGRNRIFFMRDFGKNFLIFSLFIPVFSLNYLVLSIKYGSLKDFVLYMKGVFDGLLE